MIKLTLNEKDFINLLGKGWGFSLEARKALFRHLSKLDDDVDFNPPKICGEWTEYPSLEKAKIHYKTNDNLEDCTTVIKCASGCVVVREF